MGETKRHRRGKNPSLILINTPDAYRTCHYLPESYPGFARPRILTRALSVSSLHQREGVTLFARILVTLQSPIS